MEQHVTDYLIPIYRKKGKLFLTALLTGILFYLSSFLLPKYYDAKISVLPDSATGPDLNLGSLQPVLPMLGFAPNENKTDLFIQILKSRTVGERIIARFKLKELWGINSEEKALKRLTSLVAMVATREGMILLSFEAKDPQLSAQVANAYIEELDRVNQETNSSRARNARIYISDQLHQTERELKTASRQLADYQLQHKAIALQEQLTTAIEQAGALKGKIIAKRVQLGVMLQTMKAGNPRVMEVKSEIQQLQIQYDRLQFGGEKPLTERHEFYIAFAEAPEVALRLADLMRSVKIKETVFQLLNQQFYQAKIEEAKDTPTIQVLDEAKVPEKKSRPLRMLIAATGFLIGGLVFTLRLVSEQYSRALKQQNPEEYHRWDELKKLIAGDKRKFLRRRKKS